MTTRITIAGTAIRTDSAGRYCLNDLHRASGGAQKDRPNYWLGNAQAKALIEELAQGPAGIPAGPSHPVSTVNDGTNNGTYVAKELVYAYAMWISPTFHLKVIRAYDAQQQPARTGPALPDFSDPVAAARAWADAEEGRRAAALEMAAMAPKVEALRRIQDADGSLTITAAAKTLQVKPSDLFALLSARDWIYRAREGAPWLARQPRIDAGHMEHKVAVYSTDDERGDRTATQARVTSRGLTLLARILAGERTKADLRAAAEMHCARAAEAPPAA